MELKSRAVLFCAIQGVIGVLVPLANSLLLCQKAAANQPSTSPHRAQNIVMIIVDDQNDLARLSQRTSASHDSAH